VAALVAVPAVYQLFRMGYYAQLVWNPAVTKSVARAQWGQGWTYLRDLLGTYWLLVPLGLLAGIVAVQCVEPAAISADGIGDERAFDVMAWERENPVSEEDYPFALPVPRTGYAARDLRGDGWPDHAAALAAGSAVRSVSSTCGCRRIWARRSSGSATADPPGQAVGGSAVGRHAARKPPDCFCQRVA
jgi:hypothetical protein